MGTVAVSVPRLMSFPNWGIGRNIGKSLLDDRTEVEFQCFTDSQQGVDSWICWLGLEHADEGLAQSRLGSQCVHRDSLPLPLLTKQPNQFGTDRLSGVFVRHALPLSQNRLDRAYQHTDNPPLLCFFDALVLQRRPVSPVPVETVVQTYLNSIPAILPLSVQISPRTQSTDCPSALVAEMANGSCRFPVDCSSLPVATFPLPPNRGSLRGCHPHS